MKARRRVIRNGAVALVVGCCLYFLLDVYGFVPYADHSLQTEPFGKLFMSLGIPEYADISGSPRGAWGLAERVAGTIWCLPAAVCCLAIYHRMTFRIALDNETRCGSCGQILRGLSEPRCPECGLVI